jgi:hypothetical protein
MELPRAAKATVSSSLLEAIEEYAVKVRRIVSSDPGNKVELACLYSGISGMRECVTALRKNGFLSERESRQLEQALGRLYELCSPETGGSGCRD